MVFRLPTYKYMYLYLVVTGLLGNVTNISATTTCTGTLVAWIPPSTLVGVPILYYLLTMNGNEYNTTSAFRLLTSEDVKANSWYTIFIASYNEVGEGNTTVFRFNTSAGLRQLHGAKN